MLLSLPRNESTFPGIHVITCVYTYANPIKGGEREKRNRNNGYTEH